MLVVLTVCSGNVCRSPLAAQLLRARLADLADRVMFLSVGTIARDGDLMHPQAAAWSRYLGGDPDGHRATYLTPSRLRGADLVLGMAREHRRAVVMERPALVRQAFTLRELARLSARLDDAELRAGASTGEHSDTAHLRHILHALGATRGLAPSPRAASDDDVVDPIGQPAEVFELAARQVDDAIGQVERVLRTALSS